MIKPPKTPPNSDIDGVREDQVPTVAAANEAGQGGEDLERAADESAGRPPRSKDKNAADRS